MEIDPGYCQCGCGEKTKLAPRTHTHKDWVKGEPLKFIRGHSTRGRKLSEETRAKMRQRRYSPEARARMSQQRKREQNANWRGGINHDSRGYVRVNVGHEHPLAHASGYAYEHRLVAAETDPEFDPTHDVHHVDGNRGNNAPENLEVLTRSEHLLREYADGRPRAYSR